MNRLLVLYGSQTGTAADTAEKFAKHAKRRNIEVSVSAMDAYNISELISEKFICFICSTTGDGEAPDNMKRFWRFLLRKDLPDDILSSVSFFTFGLGDSSYTYFNSAARKLSKRMVILGAKEIFPIGLGDESTRKGIIGAFSKWNNSLWKYLEDQKLFIHEGEVDLSPELTLPKCKLIFHNSTPKVVEYIERCSRICENLRKRKILPNDFLLDDLVSIQELEPKIELNRLQGNAKILTNERVSVDHELNENNSNRSMHKDVRHLSVESGLSFKEGDILKIYPKNDSTKKHRVCEYLGLCPEWLVSLELGQEINLVHQTVESVLDEFDFCQPITRNGLEVLYFFIDIADEKEKFIELMDMNDTELYTTYVQQERRGLLEILSDFRIEIPFIFLPLLVMKRMIAREFSICNSNSPSSKSIEIVVSLVKYLTPYKRLINGVCSTYLEGLIAGDKINVEIKRGSLKVQENIVNLILLGPGTGVAPLRSFLQAILDKREQYASIARIFLFFGCRRVDEDFLFREEWTAFMDQFSDIGIKLQVIVAFSRHIDGYDANHWICGNELPTRVDGMKKSSCYVQSLFRHKNVCEGLVSALQSLASQVFICGSAKKMPQHVKDGLIMLLMDKGDLSEAESKLVIKNMIKSRRYLVEAW